MRRLIVLTLAFAAVLAAPARATNFIPLVFVAANPPGSQITRLPSGGTLTDASGNPYDTFSGTVTSISCGAGLDGGTFTTSGTCSLHAPVTVALGGTNATSAGGAAVDNISGFAGTGFLTRTGAGTYAFQSAANGVTLANLAQLGANTMLGNWSSATANVTAQAMPSCSTSASALNYTTNSGVGCNSAVNAAQLGGATFAAPGPVGSGTPGTGAFTTLSASSSVTDSGLTANTNVCANASKALASCALVQSFLSVSAPTGTTSTALVMAGLARALTPQVTGRVLVVVNGDLANSTINDGCGVQISWGTGTAPVNGAAIAGTQIGAIQKLDNAIAANAKYPFSTTAYLTGASLGVAIWVDLAFEAVTGGTCNPTALQVTLIEF